MADLAVGSRVKHPAYGEGIVSRSYLTIYEIFFEKGGKMELSKYNPDIEVVEEKEGESGSGLSLAEVEKAITYILDKYQGLAYAVRIADRWKGGTIILKPANPDLQPKEITMETFFHKIVMLRDRLRVLEQNVNSHPKLDEEDKIHLQQYITRAYGSLTTFNVLFSDKEDYFKGQSK